MHMYIYVCNLCQKHLKLKIAFRKKYIMVKFIYINKKKYILRYKDILF